MDFIILLTVLNDSSNPPQVNGALGEGVSAPSKGPTPAGAVIRREACWALDYNHHPLVVVLGTDSGCLMQVLNHYDTLTFLFSEIETGTCFQRWLQTCLPSS